MSKKKRPRRRKTAPSTVPLGVNGEPLTRDDLPAPDTKRWVMRRKAVVVAGVRSGLITLNEACTRYALSVDEFMSWQRMLDRHGMAGLRSTRVQEYRSAISH